MTKETVKFYLCAHRHEAAYICTVPKWNNLISITQAINAHAVSGCLVDNLALYAKSDGSPDAEWSIYEQQFDLDPEFWFDPTSMPLFAGPEKAEAEVFETAAVSIKCDLTSRARVKNASST